MYRRKYFKPRDDGQGRFSPQVFEAKNIFISPRAIEVFNFEALQSVAESFRKHIFHFNGTFSVFCKQGQIYYREKGGEVVNTE